jgi:glycosyltransferase involved in cell wall biosynthesis
MRYLEFSNNVQNSLISNDFSYEKLISTPTVCVVLPVYNPPKDWWKHSMVYCQRLVQAEPLYDWQFHFVNDGSTNADVFPSQKALHTEGYDESLSLFFHGYSENQGKGYAIRYGLQRSDDEAHIYMHCDWDFPFGSDLLIDALTKLEEYDVVLADRGQAYLSHLPPFRQKITQTQRLFNRYVLRLKSTDTQAGFKAFNNLGKAQFLRTTVNGFLFDTEFVRLSERNELLISTLDAECRHDLQFKNFRLKVLAKEVWNLLRLIVK